VNKPSWMACCMGSGAVALWLLSSLLGAEAKLQTGTVILGGEAEQWQYLGKFGYAIGTGRYEIRLKLNGALEEDQELPRVDLDIFLDEDWPRVDYIEPCKRAADVPARKSHSMIEPGQFGEWGHWQAGALYQNVRPHIWYFALSDCRDEFAGVFGSVQRSSSSISIDYEIRWRQFDDSELSLEMRYMPMTTRCVLAMLTVLGLSMAGKCCAMQKNLGHLHPVIYALGLAMAVQWMSQALHLYHLSSFEENGVGHHGADLLAEVFFMLSQVAGASLLIAIAQGYTLLRSKLSEVELLTPVVAVVTVLHILLVAVGKLQGEQSCKYHENEGLIGWILLSIRISLFAWFRSGITMLRSAGNARVANFLNNFEIVGSAYFLAFPAIFLFVQVLAPYLQHPVLQTGLLAIQTVSWLWLADLFFSRGSYYKASELSASLLPGGAGAHCYSPSSSLGRKKEI